VAKKSAPDSAASPSAGRGSAAANATISLNQYIGIFDLLHE
jgi:hypothetical protein